MIYTTQDVVDLAHCGWLEARGDGIAACILVMEVIYSRCLAPGFPKTIHDVIYQRNAFSWTRPDDPEYGLNPQPTDTIYNACLIEAPDILLGTSSDLTRGALYYANEAVTGTGWYRTNIIENPEHPITLQYRHHTFRK